MIIHLLQLSILFSLSLTILCVSTCPQESVISECKCRQTRDLDSLPDIICDDKEVNVAKVIQSLNEHSQGEVQHFGSLYWENGAKVVLGDHFFGNITFRNLHIGTPLKHCYVSQVSPKAFHGPIAEQVQSLSIRSFELGHDEQDQDESIFQSVSVLKNLEYFALEGRYLTHVPQDAFNCDLQEQCELSKLKRINFTEGTYETFIFLTRIEDRAFYNLPSLEEINLTTQDIMFIGDFAFASSVATDTKLKINLSRQWNRLFKPESFSPDSLSELNRPVELDLWGNPFISYLPEAVFRPFFDANPDNRVRLGMQMNCSCEMQWLYADKDKYEKHFLEWIYFDKIDDTKPRFINCDSEDENLDELWQMKPEQFAHCNSKQTTVEISDKDEL